MTNYIYTKKSDDNEKKYRAKYLYLINPDKLLAEIIQSSEYISYKNLTSYSDESLNSLFKKVFEVILEYASVYTNYLIYPYRSKWYFGVPDEDINQELYEKRLKLLKLSLKNHCIIHGFFALLPKLTQNQEYSELSGKNDLFNQKGVFTAAVFDKNFKISTPNTIYQTYNSTYKQHWEKEQDYYSTILLQKLGLIEKNKIYKIPVYYKNIAYFLFRSSPAKSFSKSLLKTENPNYILKKYINLYEDYCESKKNLENDLDFFLFQTFFEYYFGFSAASYLIDKLKEMNNSTIKEKYIGLKDLEGQNFIYIIQEYLKCPMVYSRNFILSHVLDTIAGITTFKDINNDLQEKSDEAVKIRTINTNPEKSENTSTALELLKNYFHRLNNLIIPILEDLWDIVLTELLVPSVRSNGWNMYFSYIEKNMKFLTFDFSTFNTEQMRNSVNLISGKPYNPNLPNDINYSYLYSLPCNDNDNISKIALKKGYSSDVRQSLALLLKMSFTFNNLDTMAVNEDFLSKDIPEYYNEYGTKLNTIESEKREKFLLSRKEELIKYFT